ncbi:MAG: T9SS type A sorting domain-containing protein [Bacteroidales bacterium]
MRNHGNLLTLMALIFILASLTAGISAQAQNPLPDEKFRPDTLNPLSQKEKQKLLTLPELKLPPQFRDTPLPSEVDNSTQPYMREMFTQSGLDCGQTASVALGFTYEINRLRDLAADTDTTTYPSYFTWNFENGGNGWYGASYYHSMEVLRMVGNPDIETWGYDVNEGSNKMFMSGYDKYYQAMKNRIRGAYCIDVSDEEGLNSFKHWLDHHHEGDDVGGVAFFYSQFQSPSNTLPDESAHAGEDVIISWGASPNHAMAIVGYNDSIKWDYNGDGQYTNDIDINGDGVIDMRDWEIGGVKIANTYGNHLTWGEEGYAWMPYRTLAQSRYDGGIWNQTVNMLKAKASYEPQLTMKVHMRHTKREFVKMNVGMTTDLSSNEPMYLLDYPIFDYQGAQHFMQGGTDSVDQHMELGFDLTPFLNYLNPGQEAKYIFQLTENDPDGTGQGEVYSVSVIDYTSESPVETDCGQNNISLMENGKLQVPVSTSVNFEPPVIDDSTLPAATIYEPYTHSLSASGGTPPYLWSWDLDFDINEQVTTYPSVSGSSLLSGVAYDLPFEFPFYDSVYSTLWVYGTGALMFEPETTDLPYNSDDDIVFYNRKMIAPMYMDENGDLGSLSMSVQENADNVIISWSNTEHEFAVRLYQNGDIKMYYGNNLMPDNSVFVAGVSSGDKENVRILPISNADIIQPGLTYNLTARPMPEDFDISESGEITGTPQSQYLAQDLHIKLKDANNIENSKVIPISTDGFIIDYDIHTADNDSLEFGETATVDLILINETESEATGITAILSSEHPQVTITDASENIGSISPTETMTIPGAFSFDLGTDVENMEMIDLLFHVQADQDNWQRTIEAPVYAPVIEQAGAGIVDGDNNRLDPGETVLYHPVMNNTGGADLQNVEFTLTTTDPYLSITDSQHSTAEMQPLTSETLDMVIEAAPDAPVGHVAEMTMQISGDNFIASLTMHVSIGIIIENWESGDMETYSWDTGGNAGWFITTDTVFNGSYALQSGDINDNEISELRIGLEVLAQDSIRFYRKVSCEDGSEDNWDYLAFYIDGVEQDRWDGEKDWAEFAYPVNPGFHLFEWKYIKDGSVSTGADCAWLDDIVLPSIYDAPPEMFVSTDSIYKEMPMDSISIDTLVISNLGGGIISWDMEVRNAPPQGMPETKSIAGSTLECSASSFEMGESLTWDLSVTNGSEDSEWIKQIMIDFPAGMTINSATDFYDDNDTLFSNGVIGDGVIITWFNETDEGWGVITSGETATATIEADISEDFAGDMELEYQLTGDIYGAEPHYINDVLILENLGPPIDWLSLSPALGDVWHLNNDTVLLEFDTHGMTAGIYDAQLNLYYEADTLIIPVVLEVTWPVAVGEEMSESLLLYPNPASEQMFLDVNLSHSGDIDIRITDVSGNLVRRISKKDMKAGNHRFTLSVRDLSPGMYLLTLSNGREVWTKRIVVM